MKKIIVIVLCLVAYQAFALDVCTNPVREIQVCFTPGEDCTQKIINELAQARHSILVQAYSFTSAPIAQALVAAERRGVAVKVILDKSQRRAHYSSAHFLAHQKIPTWIDDKVAIAHSKVMIIDDEVIVTGSFNFTKAAQHKNAENLLVIHDAHLAKQYVRNWWTRKQVSKVLNNAV